MPQIIEPYRQDNKVTDCLNDSIKKVGIVFWHGLGDCVQFMHILNLLRNIYTDKRIDMLLQANLGQEAIFPDAVFLNDLDHLQELDYDIIFLVHFPVEMDGMTKAELCCETEIGCVKVWEYGQIPNYPRKQVTPKSKLIGIHYHNTALPDVFNPSREVAEKIWNEVLDSGFIPVELDFRHPYHNPVNEKFDFIDCTVRRVKGNVFTLLGLLDHCQGVIAVPSGPLHCSLSIMPKQVLYLEKNIPVKRFTYWDIPSVNVSNYQDGIVRNWLLNDMIMPKKVRKVFVLEDMPDRQDAFKNKFKNDELKMVNNVTEALEILRNSSFDLVCLDHDLSYDPNTGNGVFLDLSDPRAGGRVAEYLSQKNYTGEVVIQSLNSGGAEYMNKLLPQAKRIPFYWQEDKA
jgi:hypothetical protein